MKGGGMNQELVEKVAADLEASRDAGFDYESAASDVIELVGNFLRDSIPDDSADDVREALGI